MEALTLRELDDVLLELGVRRDRISIATNLPEIYREVVLHFDRRNQSERLLVAARRANPDSPELYLIAQQFDLAMRLPEGAQEQSGLEAILRPANPFLNVRDWLEKAAAAEHRVCVVNTPEPNGTGFLIGPDTVLTNYHVVERVIKGEVQPEDVSVTFDFELLAGSPGHFQGTSFKLITPDWLVDHSPYSPHDGRSQLVAADISPDQLDYAVLRVAGAPGNAQVGGAASLSKEPRPRGSFTLPGNPHDFAANPGMIIIQRPGFADRLQLAIETSAYLGQNRSGTRVFYRTNTENGSSGSPCFDMNWNLIALHNGHIPEFNLLRKANTGIPAAAIHQRLTGRNKWQGITA
jgi:hypothetical protein